MNPLIKLSRDPSCLMLVEPGGWRSLLRPGVISSGVPRNFSTDPGAFYDAAVFTPGGVTFDLSFSVVGFAGTLRVGPWGCSLYSGGIQPFFYVINAARQESVYPFGTAWIPAPAGSRVCLIGVFANGALLATLAIDGVIVSQSTIPVQAGTAPRALTPVTNADVKNLSARIVDSAGKIVWSYPSLAEKQRWITCTNVLNKRSHWEAANPSVASRIDTALDLRGRVSDYTSIVDFEADPRVDYHGEKQELTGQGAAYATPPAICAVAYMYSNGAYYLSMSQEIAGARVSRGVALPGALNGRHRVAATVRVGGTSTILSIYLDAVLLSSQAVSGVPTGIAGTANTCFSINDNRANDGGNFFGKFYAAALLTRVLSADHIARVTK